MVHQDRKKSRAFLFAKAPSPFRRTADLNSAVIKSTTFGKGGLKATEGTVSKVSEDGKTVSVKSADGTEDAYRVTSNATAKTAEEVAKGADKSAKVTVYYTEASRQESGAFLREAMRLREPESSRPITFVCERGF